MTPTQVSGSLLPDTVLLAQAGLAKLIGLAGETNVQGEEQKKLDVLSNEVLIKALISSGRTSILVSEEDDKATFVDPALRGKYAAFSNSNYGSVLFSTCWMDLQTSTAGSLLELYGIPFLSRILLGNYSYFQRVDAASENQNSTGWEDVISEFPWTLQTPKKGIIYSVNEGNAKKWDGPTAKYVENCKFPKDGSPPKSLRYVGSMVADVHRTFLYGGIFLYPADKKSPNGKLRVLYEVFPMSFLMEQAGGQAFTGKQRALDLVPKEIHERSPIFHGN
ncbi:Fructose-1,6-bisphosphatase, cytosolic-like protein [Drosera capensis]